MDPRLGPLHERIAAGVPPIALVTGEDEAAVEQATAALVAAALGGADASFALERFEAPEADGGAIVGALRTRPMFGGRRVVVLRYRGPVDAPQEPLAGYLSDPVAEACLIVRAPKVDARVAWVRAIAKAGAHFAFTVPKPRELPAVLMALARDRGAQLDAGAAARLVDEVGADLLALTASLDKCIAYAGESMRVGVAEVDACVARTREEAIWDLTDAVADRHLRKALVTLHAMLDAGTGPIMVVGSLARLFRQIWGAKVATEQRMGPDEVARAVGVHPFVARKLCARAGRLPHGTLAFALERLWAADRALKSSRLADRLLVEELLLDLCHPRLAARKGP